MLDDDIALLLDRLMRYAHHGLHQRADRLHAGEIQPSDGMLLLTLARIEPAPMHVLAATLARHKSQVTRTVQKLEAKGWITRGAQQDDGRVCVLSLTPKGQTIADELRRAIGATLRDLLDPLSPAERQTLRDLLTKVLED
ncbi:MAG: MarR family transcriptional regulator [Pseudomonadota bacterium]